MPGTKLFEVHEVPHVEVAVSEEAQRFLHMSNHQGRLLAHALSEHFGRLGCVEKVTIDLAEKREHFPNHSHPEEQVLLIVAYHRYSHVEEHRWFISADNVLELHPISNLPLFLAGNLAEELVRLYPHKHVPAPVMRMEEEEEWQQA